jgi:hypothetical protein
VHERTAYLVFTINVFQVGVEIGEREAESEGGTESVERVGKAACRPVLYPLHLSRQSHVGGLEIGWDP